MLTRGKSEAPTRPRRFYKSAAAGERDGGFSVLLDGRPVRTPQGGVLVLPTRALAELIAAEWSAQKEDIVLPSMGATRMAFTVVDHAADAHEPLASVLADYAGSDLLCYLAEGPRPLVELERERWGRMLDWAEQTLGVRLEQVSGIIHQAQPPAAVARVRELALELDVFVLTATAHAAALLGSAILALALQRDELTGEAAFDLSRLDEAFQEERWGVDEEAALRSAGLRTEAVMLERWFRALSRPS